jgi:hypothetical protein
LPDLLASENVWRRAPGILEIEVQVRWRGASPLRLTTLLVEGEER